MKDFVQTFRLLLIISVTVIVTTIAGMMFEKYTYFIITAKGQREITIQMYLDNLGEMPDNLIEKSQFNTPAAALAGGITLLIIAIIAYQLPNKPT
jgi:hypothetical protein